MPSSVVIVFVSRLTTSAWSTMPSFSAAMALHMYAPMLVVDVCTSVWPSSKSWSVGSPLSVSTIAVNDAQVCSA